MHLPRDKREMTEALEATIIKQNTRCDELEEKCNKLQEEHANLSSHNRFSYLKRDKTTNVWFDNCSVVIGHWSMTDLHPAKLGSVTMLLKQALTVFPLSSTQLDLFSYPLYRAFSPSNFNPIHYSFCFLWTYCQSPGETKIENRARKWINLLT